MRIAKIFIVLALVLLLSAGQKSAKQKVKKPIEDVEKPEYPGFTPHHKKDDFNKPSYPSISKKSKFKKSTELMKYIWPYTPKNQTLLECAQRVLDESVFATLLATASAYGFGSASTLGAMGFAGSGITAGSFAAWIQSIIGIVKAGSWFSMLQSAGMLGVGVIGAGYALGMGGVAGVIYMCNQCHCIDKLMKK